MRPEILTFSSISVVPETSCWRAITTSSLGCSRIVKEVLVSMPFSGPSVEGTGTSQTCGGYSSRRDHLDFGAARLVLGKLECLDRILQGKLSRQEWSYIHAARRQVVDGPIELNAPAESALEVELLAHDFVDDKRQRLVGQRSHLNDGTAALDRGDARLQRREAAGDFVGNVELRRRERVGVAISANRAIGAHLGRGGQRPVENI